MDLSYQGTLHPFAESGLAARCTLLLGWLFLGWLFAFSALPSAGWAAGWSGPDEARLSEGSKDGARRDSVRVVSRKDKQRVDVYVGEQVFTSYLYTDTLDVLKKPVLYPIQTAGGTEVTRGYPLAERQGERVDHPHHIGLWLNYGDVNGLDFWNNSGAVPPEEADEMGTIRHRSIRHTESGSDQGVLEVTMDWQRPDGEPILREDTRFVFRADSAGARVIDRITTLTALEERVQFPDNKEGMLGLRVTRALEMPAGEPVLLTDASGEPADTSVRDDEGVTGHYRSSEGIEGYPDVWGTRARWMMLSGEVEGQPVTLALLDHPGNVGFPTYWHVRDYGLFSANPLGQEVFSEGKTTLDFALDPGASVTFRHRLVVLSGEDAAHEVRAYYQDFASAY